MLLPEDRQNKILRLRTENRKRQSAAAYLLLVYALQKKTGKFLMPRLVGENKPFLENQKNLHVSISHCSVGAAAVVHNVPIGVDIETIRPYRPNVARYVCSAQEIAEIEESSDPALAFTVLWTKKESCIKLYGGNVGPGMKLLSERFEEFMFETKIGDGWVVTACWRK